MTGLTVVLMNEDDIPSAAGVGTGLQTEEQSLESDVEKLTRAMPVLMDKLSGVIEALDTAAEEKSGFGLESIEFSIGIEAGFTFGFTGTGNANITVTFARSPD